LSFVIASFCRRVWQPKQKRAAISNFGLKVTVLIALTMMNGQQEQPTQ
jgi:hypothetical protein